MDFNIVTICGHYLILLLLELKEGGGRKVEIEGGRVQNTILVASE